MCFKGKNTLRYLILYTVTLLFITQNHLLLAAEGEAKKDNNIYKQLELFSTVINRVQKDYVDKVTAKDLIYGALKGMLSGLDPHSQFMDPDSYKEMKVDTEGQFGGLGIEISTQDNILTVVTPIEDTPAYKAGVKSLDKIIKIDGKSTKNMNIADAVKILRGKPGSAVKLSILRPDTNEFLEISVVRDIIKIQSVKDIKMVDDKIGYVRLTQFQEKTVDELEKALATLDKQGMKGLVLDLRNNPGGLLNQAVAVAEVFIGDGKLIVYTKGRIEGQDRVYKSEKPASHPKTILVVMINKGSASGSEIVAGAIKDWRRGILVGTTSFGKGSVQSILPMNDGSALRLTTAKYYTPSGVCIHNVGIEPDIEIPLEKYEPKEDKKNLDLDEMLNDDAKKSKSDKKKEDKKDKKSESKEGDNDSESKYPKLDDNQLERAIDVVKGIMIINDKSNIAAEKTDKK